VALAHHADDQAETVLFRLARGAAGLRGMQPVHVAAGITWVRPLLGLRRAEITAWLQQIGQPWRDDATNDVPDVARNALRLEVLPALNKALGRDVTPILGRSARLQAETLDALAEISAGHVTTVWMHMGTPLVAWSKLPAATPEIVAAVKARGFRMGIWILENDEEMRAALALGADVVETTGGIKP
jgi:tRNA(Ile)-lysidine synthase TilS/MesJ